MQILRLVNFFLLILSFLHGNLWHILKQGKKRKKALFVSPKKLRKGTVLFVTEIQATLVTVCDRLLQELDLAPKL